MSQEYTNVSDLPTMSEVTSPAYVPVEDENKAGKKVDLSTVMPGTLNTDNAAAQSTNASEPLTGTVKLHKVAKTGSYSDLLDKLSIPTVGKLNTANTTAQYATSNESLSGTVNLHKVSKTGTYGDLLNRPILNTSNTDRQSPVSNETITGTIKLHKVAKTGSWYDLLNRPDIVDTDAQHVLNQMSVFSELDGSGDRIYYDSNSNKYTATIWFDGTNKYLCIDFDDDNTAYMFEDDTSYFLFNENNGVQNISDLQVLEIRIDNINGSPIKPMYEDVYPNKIISKFNEYFIKLYPSSVSNAPMVDLRISYYYKDTDGTYKQLSLTDKNNLYKVNTKKNGVIHIIDTIFEVMQ